MTSETSAAEAVDGNAGASLVLGTVAVVVLVVVVLGRARVGVVPPVVAVRAAGLDGGEAIAVVVRAGLALGLVATDAAGDVPVVVRVVAGVVGGVAAVAVEGVGDLPVAHQEEQAEPVLVVGVLTDRDIESEPVVEVRPVGPVIAVVADVVLDQTNGAEHVGLLVEHAAREEDHGVVVVELVDRDVRLAPALGQVFPDEEHVVDVPAGEQVPLDRDAVAVGNHDVLVVVHVVDVEVVDVLVGLGRAGLVRAVVDRDAEAVDLLGPGAAGEAVVDDAGLGRGLIVDAGAQGKEGAEEREGLDGPEGSVHS